MKTGLNEQELSSLALVWGVGADRVVANELGFGSCTGVLACVGKFLEWRILEYRRGGGGMAESAGASAEAL